MANQNNRTSPFSLRYIAAGAVVAALGWGLWRLIGNRKDRRGRIVCNSSDNKGSNRGAQLSDKLLAKKLSRASLAGSSGAGHQVKAPKNSVKWIPGLRVREQKILDVISHGKTVRMSDVVHHFKDVTERTLRRDMDRLVRKGRVKRLGTTRSTTYIKV